MRMSQEAKMKSQTRIVASASRILREDGLQGASVADVMKHAGMTHGGFYKHFGSKDALIERALDAAFSQFVGMLQKGDAEEAFATYRSLYLSREHMAQRGRGCPVAALGSEIARGPAKLKAAFGAGVRRVIEAIAPSRKGSPSARREAAVREFSMLVGAMVIARASDPELAEMVLASCSKETHHVH